MRGEIKSRSDFGAVLCHSIDALLSKWKSLSKKEPFFEYT